MAIVILIFLLGSICLGGWHVRSQQRLIKYQKMDVEMDALRRAIADDEAP